jgi:ankyrin repeat protein
MYAAQFNQIESARILIKNGANPSAQTIKPPNECYYSLQTFRMTPLHYAVRYASPAFIRLLLDAKASVSARAENHRDFRFVEETPLDWLRKYTVAGTSERNPNIHDHEIPEVEEWLQLPKVE